MAAIKKLGGKSWQCARTAGDERERRHNSRLSP